MDVEEEEDLKLKKKRRNSSQSSSASTAAGSLPCKVKKDHFDGRTFLLVELEKVGLEG